jgi:hypothetical protein
MTHEEKQMLVAISHKLRRGAEELAKCTTERQDAEGERLRSVGAWEILMLMQKNLNLAFSITGT